MAQLFFFLLLTPVVLASRLRRADPDEANTPNPLLVDLPVPCKFHDDCGWAEYCGWPTKPTEFERNNLAARCQPCVGCVQPQDRKWYGTALAPITGECPDCEERATEGKKRQQAAYKKIVTAKTLNADVEELNKQKQVLETKMENVELKKEKQALQRELEKVKGSVYDSNVNHQAREQALRDEKQEVQNKLHTLRQKLQTHEDATGNARTATGSVATTTSTTTGAMFKGPKAPGTYHYNTYNIYNTYNTQNTYNSNGHTFNSWSSCENASQPMPLGVARATKAAPAFLLRVRRQLPVLPASAPPLNLNNCSGLLVD